MSGGRYPFAIIKEKLLARRGEVMDFAIGPTKIPLPARIEEWIHANAALSLLASNHEDMDAFREAAAAYLVREYGVEVPGEHILPTPGGRAAISAFVACALDPGDRVAVTVPGYPAFQRLATHRHADVVELSLDPSNGFAPDVSGLTDAQKNPFRVIALNYPNNPSGATLSDETLSVASRLVSSPTIVFNDATYGPLVYDEPRRSLLADSALGDLESETIELHSFSKMFPLGPVAVSFMAGSDKTIHEVTTYSEYAWSPLSKLQLQATKLCLQDAARLDELRRMFPQRLSKLTEVLNELGFEPYPAPSGVYVLCRVPEHIGGAAVGSAGEAAERLMDDFDLAVVPLEAPDTGYLRFSSLYDADDLPRLAALGKTLGLA